MGTQTLASIELPRKLGMLDATVMIVGIVIGSGIFVLPNLIAKELPSARAIPSVWIIFGNSFFFRSSSLRRIRRYDARHRWALRVLARSLRTTLRICQRLDQ